jgi:hypothetical protein
MPRDSWEQSHESTTDNLAAVLAERLQFFTEVVALREENEDLKIKLKLAEANNAIFAARLLDTHRARENERPQNPDVSSHL